MPAAVGAGRGGQSPQQPPAAVCAARLRAGPAERRSLCAAPLGAAALPPQQGWATGTGTPAGHCDTGSDLGRPPRPAGAIGSAAGGGSTVTQILIIHGPAVKQGRNALLGKRRSDQHKGTWRQGWGVLGGLGVPDRAAAAASPHIPLREDAELGASRLPGPARRCVALPGEGLHHSCFLLTSAL